MPICPAVRVGASLTSLLDRGVAAGLAFAGTYDAGWAGPRPWLYELPATFFGRTGVHGLIGPECRFAWLRIPWPAVDDPLDACGWRLRRGVVDSR